MSRFLITYGKGLTDRLAKQLANRRKRLLPKSIHGFRLTIKRMRTLLRLINLDSQDARAKKTLKPFKKAYSSSGMLRDLHIHRKLIKSINPYAPDEANLFLKWLSKAEPEAKGRIDLSFQDFDLSSMDPLLQHLEGFEINSMDTEKFIQFIDSKHVDIRALAKQRAEDDVLHEIRKHLKDIVYTLQLIKGEQRSVSIPEENLGWLNDLQERLGTWNDWFNLHSTLKDINAEREQFPTLERLAYLEKGKYANNISACLSKFCDLKSIL